ncbi:MAG: hypothetical protein SPK36_05380 [Bacilli bacterium]|nr:hypothetical protein [Bacilli bacterium]
MQSTNNPYNKTMLMAGILTIVLGIILGVITIIINLNKYVNNINRYTEENKYTIEAKITENDNNYNSYVDEIKSLNEDKLLYQKELATFSKKDYVSKEYKEIEQKITNINAKLEELEQLKYSSLTEKNKLRKEYNEVLEVLAEKESAKSLVKCYLVGFAIIIVTINAGAYFIHLAFKPDIDDVILKNQIKIDKEYEEKLLQLQKNTLDKKKESIVENKIPASQSEVKQNTSNKSNNKQSPKKKNYNNSNKTYNRNNNFKKNNNPKANTLDKKDTTK